MTTTVFPPLPRPFRDTFRPEWLLIPAMRRERRLYERIIRICAYLETATSAPAASLSRGNRDLKRPLVRERPGMVFFIVTIVIYLSLCRAKHLSSGDCLAGASLGLNSNHFELAFRESKFSLKKRVSKRLF